MYGDLKGKEHPFWTKIKALKKAKKLGLDTTFLERLIKKEGKELAQRLAPIIKGIESRKYETTRFITRLSPNARTSNEKDINTG